MVLRVLNSASLRAYMIANSSYVLLELKCCAERRKEGLSGVPHVMYHLSSCLCEGGTLSTEHYSHILSECTTSTFASRGTLLLRFTGYFVARALVLFQNRTTVELSFMS